MTEAEWLGQQDAHWLLYHVGDGASACKLRLFCCGCVSRVWFRLTKAKLARQAVAIAEKYADDECPAAELAAAAANAEPAIRSAKGYERKNALRAVAWAAGARMDAMSIARSVVEASKSASGEEYEAERIAQAHLVRDIFGNPVRPVAFDSAWRTATVTSMAQAIYEERRFADLPILADALEDAGCTSADVLEHCRTPGEHVRGCWIVDRVLGKE